MPATGNRQVLNDKMPNEKLVNAISVIIIIVSFHRGQINPFLVIQCGLAYCWLTCVECNVFWSKQSLCPIEWGVGTTSYGELHLN